MKTPAQQAFTPNKYQSLRLTQTLREAGIDPEIFCRGLTHTINHTFSKNPTDREQFEYGLFLIQAQRFILLSAPEAPTRPKSL